MRKFVSMIIALAMLTTCFAFSAFAEEEVEPYRWEDDSNITLSLMFSGTDGLANYVVQGKTGTTKIDAILIIYFKNEKGEWKADSIWPYSEDSSRIAIGQSFTGTSGREYKANLKAIIKSPSSPNETLIKEAFATCP